MRTSLFINKYGPVFIIILFYGCIDPFEAKFESFESAIVIEATITNELKQQTVFLTRTFEFEEEVATPESNASIRVVGGGNTFTFQQTDIGVYVSEAAFAAQPGVDYQLLIETQDGKSYSSSEAVLTAVNTLGDVRAERITSDTNEDGIAILVDSFDATGSSINYRYTYEESYKIIPPRWNASELIFDPGLRLRVKQREDRVCYTTDLSNSIILTNTSDLGEDRVDDFMVRFINRNNFIISYRYSILVKQYVQSSSAYAFYDKLKQLSGDESLLSETQPGFLEGNITSQNTNEKVIGFFDVASVSEKRIFFDYSDYYPGEPLPPYIEPCILSSPDPGGLVSIIRQRSGLYAGENASPDLGEVPYFFVPLVCGDCTVLGSTEIPEFWVE